MFSHVMVGSNDIDRARGFYDGLFGKPGRQDDKGRLAYGRKGSVFMVTRPIDGKAATCGNGSTIGFAFDSCEEVDAWHARGIAAGRGQLPMIFVRLFSRAACVVFVVFSGTGFAVEEGEGDSVLMAVGRQAAILQGLFVVLAFGFLDAEDDVSAVYSNEDISDEDLAKSADVYREGISEVESRRQAAMGEHVDELIVDGIYEVVEEVVVELRVAREQAAERARERAAAQALAPAGLAGRGGWRRGRLRSPGDIRARNGPVFRSGDAWSVEDLQSTNGSYVNDVPVTKSVLRDADFLKIGAAIFKFLSGTGIEASYHEEIYKMTIVDALTGAHNKRYFLEFLEREVLGDGHGREQVGDLERAADPGARDLLRREARDRLPGERDGAGDVELVVAGRAGRRAAELDRGALDFGHRDVRRDVRDHRRAVPARLRSRGSARSRGGASGGSRVSARSSVAPRA